MVMTTLLTTVSLYIFLFFLIIIIYYINHGNGVLCLHMSVLSIQGVICNTFFLVLFLCCML